MQYSAFFTADGKHVLSGGHDGMIRRWQADDGHEVGTAIQAGAIIFAAALSRDGKWLVCGLNSQPYVRMWNAETHTKVLDILGGHTNTVLSVDISSNSTTFATAGLDDRAFIWSTTTGKQLVGPLVHDSSMVAVRFSPDARRLAAATKRSIRIFNSNDGQQLLDIPCSFVQDVSPPLAWSADGCQIFAASLPFNEARHFDSSSGSLLTKSHLPNARNSSLMRLSSIAASSNQKFVAITKSSSLTFHDALTHEKIGPLLHHASNVYFMALSPDCGSVVTGETNGKVTVRSLRGVLPDSYLIRELGQGHGNVVVAEMQNSVPEPEGHYPGWHCYTQD